MIMDDEPILLSWISQWVFCKRRFYLQIAEQNFIENVFTAEGARDHKRAHECKIERRGTHIKVTGLQVVSEKYHLFGICDSVEFEVVSDGCYIPFLEETCRIYPVEYKHGKNVMRKSIIFKWRRRHCVWRRCSIQRLQPAIFITQDRKNDLK